MFYPSIEISFDDLIRLLINREFNSINRWTKTSILHYIGERQIADKYDMELISNLFNPDSLLKEVSAWSLYKINKEYYHENSERLELHDRNHLKNLILGQKFDDASELRPHMKFELVNFLKKESLLGELPSYILASIVDFVEEVYLDNKTIIDPKEWHNECFYIVNHGMLEVRNSLGEIIDQFSKGEFLGEQINIDLLDESATIGVIGDTLLLKIDKSKFLDLITNEYEVTLKLLDSFRSQGQISHIPEN